MSNSCRKREKPLKSTRAIYFAFLILLFPIFCWSVGLRLSPPTFLLNEFPIGREIDFEKDYGQVLKITNGNPQTITYHLAAMLPSRVNTKATGFFDLPDSAWVHFDRDTITLTPQQTGQVRMYLKIPDEDRYRNQKYLWVVNVEPVETGKGGMISLAVMGLFRVETESKAGVDVVTSEVPYVSPLITKMTPNHPKKAQVRVFNNSDKECTYRIVPLDRLSPVAQLTILPTRSHRPAALGGITCRPDSIVIKPFQSTVLNVELPKPADLDPAGGEEEIFMLYPSDTLATKGYFRVQTTGPK